jgi:hypothetical protein|tara:strand:+ start:346 stop:594 length:249 start_codon:yes stop_codon:yes gene_type:complete
MALTLSKFEGKGAEQSAPLSKMKLTILKNTRINGITKMAGTVLEIDLQEATFLINTGVAAATTEKPKVKKADKATKEVKHRD